MIKLTNVRKQYQNRVVLKNINYQFPRFGLCVIYGASGSGKTTLLNCISGLIKFEGSVEFDNLRIESLTDNDLSKLKEDAQKIRKDTNIYFWKTSDKCKALIKSIDSSWLDKQVYISSMKNNTTLRELLESCDFRDSAIGATMYGSKMMMLEINKSLVDYSFTFELRGNDVVITVATSMVANIYYSSDALDILLLLGYAFQ